MGIFRNFFGQKPSQKAAETLQNVSRSDFSPQGAPTTPFRPSAGPQASSRAPRTAGGGARGFYDALNDSPDRTAVPEYAMALRYMLRAASRDRLSRISEWLFENDGLAGYGIHQIANYSAPIMPMSSCKDIEAAMAYNRFFATWCKRSDFTGRFAFDLQQRLICISLDVRGESAVAMTLEAGLPQLQIIHPSRITSDKLAPEEVEGQVDGVKIQNGAVVGYYVQPDEKSKPVLIAANAMKLLYEPEFSERYRGLSPLRRGANDIRDAKDIKGFEKKATKISSALAAVIEGSDFEDADVWGEQSGNGTTEAEGTVPGNLPPADATPHELNITVADLLGGDILTLPDGKKLHQLDNNRPGDRVLEMLDYLGGCFVSGLGLPPAFLIDAKLTGPNQRSVNGKAQRRFDNRQALMAELVEWVWVRVIGWGIATKQLPAADGWDSIEWQGPARVSIDEGKDAQAWREDVEKRLMTRQNHFANRNLNWMRETDQAMAEDDYILARAVELAKKHGLAPEVILAKWGFESAQPSPVDPNTDPEPTPDENSKPITD